jgi:hypothetical protein
MGERTRSLAISSRSSASALGCDESTGEPGLELGADLAAMYVVLDRSRPVPIPCAPRALRSDNPIPDPFAAPPPIAAAAAADAAA